MVAIARFYDDIANQLLSGAVAALDAAGASHDLVELPGALEIPAAIRIAHESGKYDGYVALGCVIRGETSHYDIVAGESARGLMELAVAHGLAIGNGVLTTENHAQAWERAATDRRNKGADAVRAALDLITLRARLGGGRP